MDKDLQRFRESIAVFDVGDLAAGMGALQLLPINAERQLRFDRLAALVYSFDQTGEGPNLSPARWRTILNSSPIARPDVMSAEDPAEDLFTDAVSFIGGSYVVFPGIAEHSAEITRLLLKAVVLSVEPLPEEFVGEIQALAFGMLKLSDAVAKRAGLKRNTQPQRPADGRVSVPASARFASLKDAVTFDDEELQDLLDPVPIDVLSPLTVTEARELDPDDEVDLAVPYRRPLLRSGDRWRVALPSGLLVALRHRIIVRAQELGLEDELAARYRAVTHTRVARSLRWMGWSELPWRMNDTPPWSIESFWQFDVDKIAHVIVAADDLSDYGAQEPFGRWVPSFANDLDSRFESVRDRIRSTFDETESILSMLVLQGVGRQSAIPLPAVEMDGDYETIVLWQPDLAAIARFEAGDTVALWKFARNRSRLRHTTSVVAWSVLDEYGAYRSHRHSFYIGDESPTHIYLDPTFGAGVRFEDAERFDFHGVARWDGAGIMEVQRRWDGSQARIYLPDPLEMERVEFLVEGHSLPIWVYQHADAADTAESRSIYFELCDAVAFWTWEAAKTVDVLVEHLVGVCDSVDLTVAVGEVESWGSLDGLEPIDNWLEVGVSGPGQIDLVFSPATQIALGGPDNSGERELLRRILEALRATARSAGYPQDDININAAVDECAPLGVKKKVMFIDTSTNIRLTPGDLPPLRTVEDANVEELLDAAGPAVADALGLDEGPISEEHRSEVLNATVRIHFEELVQIISELSPEGLPTRLVGHHEAVVKAYYEQRLSLPTQLACFGSDDDYLSEIHQRVDRLVRADQALRFLIEYVTAQPPSGTKALSVATLDRLMALAYEMINKGMLSDAVYYGFGDVDMQMLPSGRLGTDKEGRYVLGVESFREVQSRHDVRFAHDYFGEHWQAATPSERPAEIDQLDVAAQAEFGLTITEFAHLVGDLLNMGVQQLDQEPKSLPLTLAVETLAASLGWSTEKTEQGIENLALRARQSFFPDEGAMDVYPWRFNRERSYVRRPVLVWNLEGEETLFWGIRHLDRVGPNLLNLIHSARLKARSPEMRSYMGTMRRRENEAFNDEVAEILESDPGLVVRRRVEKIGPTRIERSPGQPLGDVDVLVVDRRRRRIEAIETKDLEQARTPIELANEIEKLFEGDDSTVQHHLERVEWLREHTIDVLQWLRVEPGRGRWRVEGKIVVSRPLVTPYFADSPLPVMVVDDLTPSD